MTSTWWYSAQPSCTNTCCAIYLMTTGYKWASIPCSSTRPVVCERELIFNLTACPSLGCVARTTSRSLAKQSQDIIKTQNERQSKDSVISQLLNHTSILQKDFEATQLELKSLRSYLYYTVIGWAFILVIVSVFALLTVLHFTTVRSRFQKVDNPIHACDDD